MRELRTLFLLLASIALAASLAAQDQDSPSLGDVARRARLQRQKDAQAHAKDAQSKNTQGNDAAAKDAQAGGAAMAGKDSVNNAPSKAESKDASGKETLAKGSKKVITNDEIPEHVGPTSTLPQQVKMPVPDYPTNNQDYKTPPQYLKQQILQMKESISNLESEIQDLTDSIRYAGGNCVSNCVQWNAQQQMKQQQVEAMTSQLAQQQKALETIQEMARKQGYSSAIYDP